MDQVTVVNRRVNRVVRNKATKTCGILRVIDAESGNYKVQMGGRKNDVIWPILECEDVAQLGSLVLCPEGVGRVRVCDFRTGIIEVETVDRKVATAHTDTIHPILTHPG